jgi:hypothetical protein
VNQEMRRCGYKDVELIFIECSDEDETLLLQVHRMIISFEGESGSQISKSNYIHVKDLEKRGN